MEVDIVVEINVSKDFTETPGARYYTDGEFSGQEFRDKLLEPSYKKAIKEHVALFIDLDGGYGYATSFLEEAFGGLARIYPIKEVLVNIRLKSDDEPGLINDIRRYISEARSSKPRKRK